jgi:hypothetical protein
MWNKNSEAGSKMDAKTVAILRVLASSNVSVVGGLSTLHNSVTVHQTAGCPQLSEIVG